MQHKIFITGPESTGKTTLAKALANELKTAWVPEFSRSYLTRLGRPYRKGDLLEIAKGQLAWQQGAKAQQGKPIVCDTGMLVLKIWSEYKYKNAHRFILEQLENQQQHLHLLCAPDIPWADDPLRENPADRAHLFQLFTAELERSGTPYATVQGDTPEQRLASALEAVSAFLPERG